MERAQQLRREYCDGYRSIAYVTDFLEQSAAQSLHDCLARAAPWGLKLSDGSRILGLSPGDYGGHSRADLISIEQLAYSAAQRGFAFMREEVWPSPRDTSPEDDSFGVLEACESFLRGHDFIGFVEEVTGATALELVSVQFVRYRPGCFYSFTNCAPTEAKVGFTLNLTPRWMIDWGGLQQFRDIFGCVECAHSPRFNALSIYALSTPVGVSFIAPFAQESVYAVTGQLERS